MEQLWRTFGNVLVVLVVIVPVLALAAWGLAVVRGKLVPRRTAWVSSLLDAAMLLALLPVLYLVFVPIPGLENRTMISLVPGAEILPVFGGEGTTPAGSALVQALGNLLLLAPLAALVPLRVRRLRSVLRVVVAALLMSVAIECAQAVLHVGRASTTDDVLLNTAGAALGALLSRRWWHGIQPAIDVSLHVSAEPPSRTAAPR